MTRKPSRIVIYIQLLSLIVSKNSLRKFLKSMHNRSAESKRDAEQKALYNQFILWIDYPSSDTQTSRIIVERNFLKHTWSEPQSRMEEKRIGQSEVVSADIQWALIQSIKEYEVMLMIKANLETERKITKKKNDKEFFSKPLFVVGLFLIFSLIFSWPIYNYFLNIEPSAEYLTVMGTLGFSLLALSVIGREL